MLKGKRVTIKPFETETEVTEFINLYNNLDERSPLDHDELADTEKRMAVFRLTGFVSGKYINYMILNEDNEFIGTVGYKQEAEFERVLGYRILLTKYRGKGYMSEVLKLFIPFAFTDTVDRLSLFIHAENTPSIGIAKKFGFTQEGHLRRAYQYRGRRVDAYTFSLLKEEYMESTKSE